ncbi:N-alpha-acetyltransferase 30 [Aphelenchoides besseyi]|nr:N-alpha-acetyltransferase 30 [Aphelenchoides besseyi]KAI6199758.1 N-alpha-acetyltransferase 30 [Aphelenchoides besseyi]
MEPNQNHKKFAELVSDTVSRLQHCMNLIGGDNRIQVHAETEPSLQPSSESSKKRAKRAKKNARRKDQQQAGNAIRQPLTSHLPEDRICLEEYRDESQIDDVMRLIGSELSEPYSIYTYRYFINKWPHLCLLAFDTQDQKNVGVVVCKIDDEEPGVTRVGPPNAYIAMLAVDKDYRRLGIGTKLVSAVIKRMHDLGCGQVVLETEVTNTSALNLYSRLGFIRERRLFRYYLSGTDAFRVKLYFSLPQFRDSFDDEELEDEGDYEETIDDTPNCNLQSTEEVA